MPPGATIGSLRVELATNVAKFGTDMTRPSRIQDVAQGDLCAGTITSRGLRCEFVG